MAEPHPPKPVLYLCGLIAGDEDLLAQSRAALEPLMGPAGLVSPVYPFDLTDYYSDTMGPHLLKQFVIADHLDMPDKLPDLKHATNAIEAPFATAATPRPINLDPGYLTPAKLVLASMKNFAHRIYLRDSVYAEVTLTYNHGWQPTSWTFPDFASGRYDAFLNQARDFCARKLAEARS
jgi:hypothetical protein